MAGRWNWLAGYALVIVFALVLGGLLSELALFKQATLGKSKLTAGDLVRFVSYAGSLYLVWLAGSRAAVAVQQGDSRYKFIGFLLPPLTTLIVVIGAYHTMLVVMRPFFSAAGRNMYNWLFVLAIAFAAIWLATVLFNHAQSIVDLFRSGPVTRGAAVRKCPGCGAAVSTGARFCPSCGKPV